MPMIEPETALRSGFISEERRAFRRVPSKFQARILYGNMVLTGTVTDLSEGGMFVSTKINFPPQASFTMAVLANKVLYTIPVKVRRSVNGAECLDMKSGIGVEMVNIPKDYLDFIKEYEAAA